MVAALCVSSTALSQEPPPPALAPVEPLPDSPAEAPDPADPIAVLYGRRLTFADGVPHVTVRILEGERRFTFTPNGPVTITARGSNGRTAHGPRGGVWTVRLVSSTKGRSIARVLIGEHLFADSQGAESEAELFRKRGYSTAILSVGSVYGIAGRTVDTRRLIVVAEANGTEAGATKLAREIADRYGLKPEIHREPVERGRGTIEVLAPAGEVVLRSADALTIEATPTVTIHRVEHSMGYPNHGREDRRYGGRVYAVVDARGELAAVNLVGLEPLAKGIVPSEIFASAHPEALKAQAVTARGEILAKVGARHVADPYLLCAEQHCQVYRGVGGEDPRTSRAVDATRGEALFSATTRTLVPSYYSAICGGHTEDNDHVWGGPADASIRGRPDFPITDETRHFSGGITESLLREWLESDVPTYCQTASASRKSRYRWSRRFTQAEVDAIARPLEAGRVKELVVEARGVSGRARTLLIRGDRGEARVHGELTIRKLFRMLNSAMFYVDAVGSGRRRTYVFHGGGWGHGAGMCQTGAIGRAEAGSTYRDILRHYFSGAEVVGMYD